MEIAKELSQKSEDGKTTYKLPDYGQMARLVVHGQILVDALRNFQALAAERSSEFPVLKTLPMTKVNIDSLQQKLDAIKNMPY